MSADMKAAEETAKLWTGMGTEDLANPPAANLAAAFLELHADLKTFHEAEIQWMDALAAKDAELEQERKASSELLRIATIDHHAKHEYCARAEEAEKNIRRLEQRAAELERRLETTRQLNDIRAHESREAIIRAADLQTRLERVEEAFNAACAFIDSHVGDPDITAEMVRTYAEFQRLRVLISTQNAADRQTETAATQAKVHPETGSEHLTASLKPAPAAAYTDHPTRHWDRTCPACNSAAPDPAIEGLELAAKICHEIRAELERRRNKP